MKTIKTQLLSGENIEIEDGGMSYCLSLCCVDDSRIIGLGCDAENRITTFVWKKVGDLWKHHFNISMSVDGDGDDLLAIATHNHVMLELGRPTLEQTMNLIVVS